MATPDHPDVTVSSGNGAVGSRVRELRTERGISLRSLAAALGISPSALSQIELGKMRPSVNRLIQIMNELDIPLAAAFADLGQPGERQAHTAAPSPDTATSDGEVVVSRAGEIPVLTLGHGVRYRRLSPTPLPGIDIYESTYPPGASSAQHAEFLRHDGHEMGSVLSGTLTVDFTDERIDLHAGDAISFASATPHRICNRTDTAAVAVWINMP